MKEAFLTVPEEGEGLRASGGDEVFGVSGEFAWEVATSPWLGGCWSTTILELGGKLVNVW